VEHSLKLSATLQNIFGQVQDEPLRLPN